MNNLFVVEIINRMIDNTRSGKMSVFLISMNEEITKYWQR